MAHVPLLYMYSCMKISKYKWAKQTKLSSGKLHEIKTIKYIGVDLCIEKKVTHLLYIHNLFFFFFLVCASFILWMFSSAIWQFLLLLRSYAVLCVTSVSSWWHHGQCNSFGCISRTCRRRLHHWKKTYNLTAISQLKNLGMTVTFHLRW